ncbi:hypothetical protein K1719_020479 [Acacia pycnantha]|nr:hypothetical protein K1719_020479 [Acacia pycnantha]
MSRHIKRNCRVKLSKANVACTSEGDNQLNWDHCFTVEAIEQKSTQAFLNYAYNKKDEWIIDSGLTKNLVSVPQITDSRKCVLFGPNDVKVLDNVEEISADVIFSGGKKGSLFVMSACEAYEKKTSQTDNLAIRHARLSHIGYQMLHQISSKKLVDGMPALKNVREMKGWRCMDLEIKKYTTSRDVVFDEVSSPFSTPKFVALNDDQDNLELLFPKKMYKHLVIERQKLSHRLGV